MIENCILCSSWGREESDGEKNKEPNQDDEKEDEDKKCFKQEDTVDVVVNTHLKDGLIGREMIDREEDIKAIEDLERANKHQEEKHHDEGIPNDGYG